MSTARLRAALAAGAAAVATAAVLAASGSAAPAHRTLHFVAKTDASIGFFAQGAPHEGSTFGFGDTITGSDTGTDRGVCTVIGRKALCTVHVQLSRGTLEVQGLVPEHSHHTPLAVVGGTGAYKGASGTARVTDLNDTTTKIEVALVK